METIYIVEGETLTGLADAVRAKVGVSGAMTPEVIGETFENWEAEDQTIKIVDGSIISYKSGDVSTIGRYAFYNCTNLTSATLAKDSVVTLSNVNAFGNTPMSASTYTGSFGSIYVPAKLHQTYKTATNWVSYADRIMPIGIYVDSISCGLLLFGESQQISLSVCGALSDMTCEVTSSNEDVATISNVVFTNELVTFNINANSMEGESVIKVVVRCDNDEWSTEDTIKVFAELPTPTYEVQDVSGASYGFVLNSNGYYESTNKGVNSSAAVCKLVFNTQGLYNLYLDCINSGESNYDFGLISNVDTTLTTTSAADSSGVFKSFKGSSSTSIQTVDMGVIEAGEHFIYIKFRKDSSSASGNDSLQFKVRIE